MTTAPQLKKTGGDNHWLVKNEQGETFGPVAFETLKLWAKDGRLAPTNILSENATTWSAVTQYPELEMDWVAEVSPGTFYGPIHKLALEALKKEGSLPADAVAFQRPPAVRSARKTQPISAISPVAPPHPKNDSDAVRALERQLDLERQRSHDMMKQFEQMNKQLTHIHTQLSAKESAPALEEPPHLILDAIAQAQSHIVSQVSQQVSVAFAQAQEQMRKSVPMTHEPAAQGMAAELARTQEQMRNTVSVAHEHVVQSMAAELAKTQERLSGALALAQRDMASQTTQAVSQTTQAVLRATEPIAAQLLQHRQELERFGTLIHASRAPTAEAIVSAVASLLATGREELFNKMVDELAASRDQLFERTNMALTQGREQMMRATGDSQRIAIEYIVREITAILTQALQAGRENLLQGMRSGWADVQQQAASVDARLAELQASQGRLKEELKAAIQKRLESSRPVVEHTYVEAEAVEVIPPERPRKKIHPEPEIVDPPPAGKTGPTNTTGPGLSMADIEQQARRELERLGSQGMNIFKRKK